MTQTSEATTTQEGAGSGRRNIYFFGEGRADGSAAMRDTLGGKGAGLAEMTNAGVPVPPGFTIATDVCRWYYAHGGTLPPGFDDEQRAALERLQKLMQRRLGDPSDPLLVSVRSGAKFSMPGMMDTILNLGLNDRSVEGLAHRTGNARFAWDCYRRFIQMFGSVVMGLEKHEFEERITALKKRRGVKTDPELTAQDLQTLVREFKALVHRHAGRDFPQDPLDQLRLARDAVFQSWNNDRAVYYRRQNRIPDDIGTAVNVQAMVFGNLGETSATGVGFTRNPATGENHFYGEFLTNAQGEDVVAGVRTPRPIEELRDVLPDAFRQLREITARLEKHYRDVQDFEFTIQEGKLFLLQTRTGKRTAAAAVRIAVEMSNEALITRDEAVLRVEPASLDQLLHPRLDPAARLPKIARGLAASPGAAVGRVVFDADTAAARGKSEPVILVRKETTPDDIHGMDAAQGILTATGGHDLHAAVVARGMGKPCVCGAGGVHVDDRARTFVAGGKTVGEGDWISIDGSTGEVDARPGADAAGRGDRRVRRRSWAGPTNCGACACARTPTFRATRSRRAHSAPRASACAAPSTCSSPRIVCRTWSRMILAAPEAKSLEVRRLPRKAQLEGGGTAAREARRRSRRFAGSSRRPSSAIAMRSPSCCRFSAPISAGCSRPWTVFRSPSARSIRRCTSSCPSARN